MRQKLLTAILAGSLISIGCETKKATNFSILPEANVYAQDGVYEPRKIDILWIIDNSGSMKTSQENLANNFQSFIERFHTLKFDYHIGVGATDSWKTLFDPNLPHGRLRDGADTTAHSGTFIIDRNTPDVINTFMINAQLGIKGTGDERAFQSLQATLTNPNNTGFRRGDAFLAVIIVSDEDDFSHDAYSFLNSNYNDPNLHSVQKYVDLLDQYTGRTDLTKPANYSVSAITVTNDACKTELNKDGFARYPGARYMELVQKTGGTVGSLCESFADTLSNISDSIVNYSSVFPLTRLPLVDTIQIHINGQLVPKDEVNGWTYRESDNSIWFHGTSIPPAGSQISIDFDPAGIKL
jgi:hypothetical protein